MWVFTPDASIVICCAYCFTTRRGAYFRGLTLELGQVRVLASADLDHAAYGLYSFTLYPGLNLPPSQSADFSFHLPTVTFGEETSSIVLHVGAGIVLTPSRCVCAWSCVLRCVLWVCAGKVTMRFLLPDASIATFCLWETRCCFEGF